MLRGEAIHRKGLASSFQLAMNGALELPDSVEASPPDGLFRDEAEPALHEVEPGGAGGSEVQLEAGMLGKPGPDRGVFVGAVVVADEVDLPSPVSAVDRLQEVDELHVSVLREAAPVDLSAGHLKSGEQAGRAVTFVVVSHTCGQIRAQRQDRL